MLQSAAVQPEQDHYSNGIAHYIECREGYDRLLERVKASGREDL